MNITYVWAITGMKMAPSLDGLTDVVTNVQFNYTGTDSDSGFSSTFNGAYPVPPPSSADFVPLADLTEAEVIAWIEPIYPIDHPNEVIELGIQDQITPVDEDAPMPWAPEPTPIPPVE
jgi:hypothetical protein